MKKNIILSIVLIIMCLSILVWRPSFMIPEQYKMFFTLSITDPNDPDYPVGKKWFDASEWLRQPQYIKVSDYFLINTKFNLIETTMDFGITNSFLYEIQQSQYAYPELGELVNMNHQQFYRLMKNKIEWEYLYSKFNKDTLKPEIDYFLMRFPYKEKWYEVYLNRTPYQNDYSYFTIGLYKSGEWYKENDTMTYKQYLESQATKTTK